MELTFLKTFALLTLQICTKLPSLELISDIGFTNKQNAFKPLKKPKSETSYNYKLEGIFSFSLKFSFQGQVLYSVNFFPPPSKKSCLSLNINFWKQK